MERVYKMQFGSIYPLLLQKAEKKGRTRQEVDEVIHWLTGYPCVEIRLLAERELTYAEFFQGAPRLNPNRELIRGDSMRRLGGGDTGASDAGNPLFGQAGG